MLNLRNMTKAIYPGAFDPVTNGHLDVLRRASAMFDSVTVVIASNRSKDPMFTKEERKELLDLSIKDIPNVDTHIMENALTVDYAKSVGAIAIVRGLRAISDFEYEFQMAQMNRTLNEEIETVFFMPNDTYFFTSSQLVKDISMYEIERIKHLIPAAVQEALSKKFNS